MTPNGLNDTTGDAESPVNAQGGHRDRSWPDYRTLWRWHFFAGVACLPLIVLLSVTGSIYLFRPQIEAWQQSGYDANVGPGSPLPYDVQVRRAVQQIDDAQFVSLELLRNDDEPSATRMVLAVAGVNQTVWVNPVDGRVIDRVESNQTFLRKVRRLHGELMLGKRGSYLVETVASWTIVLVITGLALWMPRPLRVAGVLYPRLSSRGKTFWRDLHSVVGFWASGLIVFLIASGLPWSTFWGDYFKSIRRVTGTAVARQSWDGGHAEHGPKQPQPTKGVRGGSPWKKTAPDPATYDLDNLNLAAAQARSLAWLPPVTVSPPSDGDGNWVIKSETPNRPYRRTAHFDVAERQVCHEETFAQKHWVDQIVGQGIAIHEGQRFAGSPWNGINQAAAMFATIALVGLSGSGTVLWWRRGRAFRWAPPELRSSQFSVSRPRQIAVIAVILALAIYLPLFGVSLVIVRLTESIWKRVRRSHAAPIAALMMGTACTLSIGGCGTSQAPIDGGTVGNLTSGGIPMSQVQVFIHEPSGATFETRAIGMVRPDGSFELVAPDASAPVILEDGDYVVTIESLGAEIEIPGSLSTPGSESLVHHHVEGQSLDLALPLLTGME